MNEQTPACDALLGFCFEGPVRGLKENPGFLKTQSLMDRLTILLSLSFNYTVYCHTEMICQCLLIV